jgi:hypothetical protein
MPLITIRPSPLPKDGHSGAVTYTVNWCLGSVGVEKEGVITKPRKERFSDKMFKKFSGRRGSDLTKYKLNSGIV